MQRGVEPAQWLVVLAGGTSGFRAASIVLRGLNGCFPAPILLALPSSEKRQAVWPRSSGSEDLRVIPATQGMSPVHGCCYLAPAGRALSIAPDSTIVLRDVPDGEFGVADLLFATAAPIYKNRLIAVVLSGGGHDGTRGLLEVTKYHGIRIVQSPPDSQRSEMPSNAVLKDHPNYVTRVHDIAPLLLRIVREAPQSPR